CGDGAVLRWCRCPSTSRADAPSGNLPPLSVGSLPVPTCHCRSSIDIDPSIVPIGRSGCRWSDPFARSIRLLVLLIRLLVLLIAVSVNRLGCCRRSTDPADTRPPLLLRTRPVPAQPPCRIQTRIDRPLMAVHGLAGVVDDRPPLRNEVGVY
ncbi:uncharacterized protein BJ171DRAFT_504805, partial [Polychytrium aggregatum]|uniref:uncharacterized protein n=1 Tax=Polychytrium aggregatum TaxID=110093 RepID=UPI0022FE2035